MLIRPETSRDIDAIRAVTLAAFAGKPYSSGTEAAIVAALRGAEALTLSLVACEHDDLLGHVAFSPASIGGRDLGLYALGPVSVRPERQRQGIGAGLIRDGLARLTRMRAVGCILVGAPEYYGRFGFALCPARCPPDMPPAYFQMLTLTGEVPPGAIAFHPAFAAAG
jgi:putative acetyltransferase